MEPERYTYSDRKRAEADTNRLIPIEDYARAFFLAAPGWVIFLMGLRNRIVALFGLKTSRVPDNREHILSSSSFEIGDEFGLFKVYDKSDRRIVLGQDDTHLDIRIEIEQKPEQASVFIELATHVRFNNTFGRLYFSFIKPFHNVISRQLLRRMIKTS